MIREITFLDFENGRNGLIEYLNTIGQISRIEIQPLTFEVAQDVVGIEIEFELISFVNLRHTFPNVEIIENNEVSMGKCRMIVS